MRRVFAVGRLTKRSALIVWLNNGRVRYTGRIIPPKQSSLTI